jgi:beta-lactam-binding protein with PASTA domain
MLATLLKILGWMTYVALVLVVFVLAGYFSFSIFVRSGVTTVPELVNLSDTEVAARLLDHGLRMRRAAAADRYDEEVAAGHILKQSPGAGSLVKRGSSVEVTVSLGPELLEVPDLNGRALQAAQVTLNAAGLIVGRTGSVFSAGALPGTVVAQDPPPGTRVGRAAPITLFLSQGSWSETYVMPDLVYRDLEEVRRFFERRGFRLGSVKFEPYEGIASGIVLRQFPLSGHPLRRRDVISLVVTTQEHAGQGA